MLCQRLSKTWKWNSLLSKLVQMWWREMSSLVFEFLGFTKEKLFKKRVKKIIKIVKTRLKSLSVYKAAQFWLEDFKHNLFVTCFHKFQIYNFFSCNFSFFSFKTRSKTLLKLFIFSKKRRHFREKKIIDSDIVKICHEQVCLIIIVNATFQCSDW